MRAFLSHSSVNKEFVKQVADELGRFSCIFDKYDFETGERFEASIINHLSLSSIFVFFATRESLISNWCKYELSEAFHKIINKHIDSATVYIIQPGISHADLPSWMQKFLIKEVTSPATIARDIKSRLEKMSSLYQKRVFVGRNKEREEFEEIINPIDGNSKPKVIAFHGLPGVGRRASLKKFVPDLISYDKFIEIYVEPGDNLQELCIKLADLVEAYSNKEELTQIALQHRGLSDSDAVETIIQYLNKLIDSKEVPVLVDDGGIVLESGLINSYFNKLMVSLIQSSCNLFVFLILNRKINKENLVTIPCIKIDLLEAKSIGRLLVALGGNSAVQFEANEIADLSEYLDGYPPAAYFAVTQAKEYGVSSVLSDKSSLVQFSKRRFVSHLRSQKLSEGDIKVLRVLAAYSPMPLSAILALYSSFDANPHSNIYELIDCSLIRVENGKYYRICDPIAPAVREMFGGVKSEELITVKEALVKYVDLIDDTMKLEFARVLFRISFVLSDSGSSDLGLALRADYVKMVEQAYHHRNYATVIEIAREVLKDLVDDVTTRSYYVRALIQEENYAGAEEQLKQLSIYGDRSEVHFLRGFLLRKKGDFDYAISELKKASGGRSKKLRVNRELAHCYFMIDMFDEAEHFIKDSIDENHENQHILDLAAKIAIKKCDRAQAERYLKRLELLDRPEHYLMRKSSLHLVYHENELALDSASKSVDAGGSRFLPGRVQKIKCLILMHEFSRAHEEITSLDADFSRTHLNVRTALGCLYFYHADDYKALYECSKQFSNQNTLIAKKYRKKALEKLSSDVSISFDTRRQYQYELNYLDIIVAENDFITAE